MSLGYVNEPWLNNKNKGMKRYVPAVLLAVLFTMIASFLSIIIPSGSANAQDISPKCSSIGVYGDSAASSVHGGLNTSFEGKVTIQGINETSGTTAAYKIVGDDQNGLANTIIGNNGGSKTLAIVVSPEQFGITDVNGALPNDQAARDATLNGLMNPAEIAEYIKGVYDAAAGLEDAYGNREIERVIIVPPFPKEDYVSRHWDPSTMGFCPECGLDGRPPTGWQPYHDDAGPGAPNGPAHRQPWLPENGKVESLLEQDHRQALIHAFNLMAGVANEKDPNGNDSVAPDGAAAPIVPGGALAPGGWDNHEWIRNGANAANGGPELVWAFPEGEYSPDSQRDALVKAFQDGCDLSQIETPHDGQGDNPNSPGGPGSNNNNSGSGSNRPLGEGTEHDTSQDNPTGPSAGAGGNNTTNVYADGKTAGGLSGDIENENVLKPYESSMSSESQVGNSPSAFANRAANMSSHLEAISRYTQVGRWNAAVSFSTAPRNWANPGIMEGATASIASWLFNFSNVLASLLMQMTSFAAGNDIINVVVKWVDFVFGKVVTAFFSDNVGEVDGVNDNSASIGFSIFFTALISFTLIVSLLKALDPSTGQDPASRLKGVAIPILRIIFTFFLIAIVSIQSEKNGIDEQGALEDLISLDAEGENNQQVHINDPQTWSVFSVGWILSNVYYYVSMIVDGVISLIRGIVFTIPEALSSAEGLDAAAVPTTCDKYVDSMHYILMHTKAFNSSSNADAVSNSSYLVIKMDQLFGKVQFDAYRLAFGGSGRSAGNTWCLELERRSSMAPGDSFFIARTAGIWGPVAGTGGLIGDNKIVSGNSPGMLERMATQNNSGGRGEGILVMADGQWRSEYDFVGAARWLGRTDADSEVQSRFYHAACEWNAMSYLPRFNYEWLGVNAMGTGIHDNGDDLSWEKWSGAGKPLNVEWDGGIAEMLLGEPAPESANDGGNGGGGFWAGVGNAARDVVNWLGDRKDDVLNAVNNYVPGAGDYINGVISGVGQKMGLINNRSGQTPMLNNSFCMGQTAIAGSGGGNFGGDIMNYELNPVMPHSGGYNVALINSSADGGGDEGGSGGGEEGGDDETKNKHEKSGFGAEVYPVIAWRYSQTNEDLTDLLRSVMVGALNTTPGGVFIGNLMSMDPEDEELTKTETNPDVKFIYAEVDSYNPAEIYYKTVNGQALMGALFLGVLSLISIIIVVIIIGLMAVIALVVNIVLAFVMGIVLPLAAFAAAIGASMRAVRK